MVTVTSESPHSLPSLNFLIKEICWVVQLNLCKTFLPQLKLPRYHHGHER